MGRYYGVVVRNYSYRWRHRTQAEVEANLVEKVEIKMFLDFFIWAS